MAFISRFKNCSWLLVICMCLCVLVIWVLPCNFSELRGMRGCVRPVFEWLSFHFGLKLSCLVLATANWHLSLSVQEHALQLLKKQV